MWELDPCRGWESIFECIEMAFITCIKSFIKSPRGHAGPFPSRFLSRFHQGLSSILPIMNKDDFSRICFLGSLGFITNSEKITGILLLKEPAAWTCQRESGGAFLGLPRSSPFALLSPLANVK